MKPLNAIAETIVRLRSEVENDERQASYFSERASKNLAAIAELEPLAEWEPIEQPIDEPVTDLPIAE